MNQAAVVPVRRLTSAVLFSIASIFIFVNLGVYGYGEMDIIDAILTTTWSVCWAVAAVQNLSYRAALVNQTLTQTNNNPTPNNQIFGYNRSTHSKIKGLLTTATATSALAMDAYRMREITPAHTERLIGSILWLQVGFFEICMANKHERKQEKYPHLHILPYGKKPETLYALNASIYLLAGISYALAVWSDEQNSPLENPQIDWIKAVPNICWLVAGLNEVSRTFQAVLQEQGSENKECELNNKNENSLSLPI